MNQLIEPNFHPVLVHFAFALVVAAAAGFAVVSVVPAAKWRASLQPAADWMLAFGALAIVLTVAAGFQAYYSVAHDAPSHAAMTTHRNWALPSGLAVLALAFWRWRRRAAAPSRIFAVASLAAAALLTVTAWWGGRLVYGHGLGVRALPQAEAAGHDHDAHPHETIPAASAPSQQGAWPDTPEGTVDAFSAALRAGDAATLRRLMAPDVMIAESGGVERSFDEYAAHHMGADMAFSATVSSTLEERKVEASGDAAAIVSQMQVHGAFRGETVHARMMETMVLRRIGGQWRITHIHWSSAPITGDHAH